VRIRKIFYHSSRYLLVLLIFLMPFIRNISSARFSGNNAYGYFLFCFGGLYAASSLDVMTLLLFLVPQFLLIYLFSDIMQEDCLINAIYVFPRMGKKQKWLFQKTIQIFSRIVIAFAFLFFLALILAIFSGMSFEPFNAAIFKMLLDMFFFQVLSIFLFSFLQNFLSLQYGSAQSFFLVVLLYTALLGIALVSYHSGVPAFLLALLIPTNQMTIWHCGLPSVPGAEGLLGNPLNGFKTWYSYLILIGFSVLCYRIARHIFLQRDSIEMMKEE